METSLAVPDTHSGIGEEKWSGLFVFLPTNHNRLGRQQQCKMVTGTRLILHMGGPGIHS